MRQVYKIVIIVVLVLSVSTTAQGASFDQRVDSKLTGGKVSSKADFCSVTIGK